jgi:hypothetical protein
MNDESEKKWTQVVMAFACRDGGKPQKKQSG